MTKTYRHEEPKMRIAWLVAFGFLQVLDVLTTERVLARGGWESNPVQELVQTHFGSMWWAPKLIMMLACLFVMARWNPRHVMPFVVLMTVIVGNNLFWAFA
jgi:Domain of unknown function (DUF5658)